MELPKQRGEIPKPQRGIPPEFQLERSQARRAVSQEGLRTGPARRAGQQGLGQRVPGGSLAKQRSQADRRGAAWVLPTSVDEQPAQLSFFFRLGVCFYRVTGPGPTGRARLLRRPAATLSHRVVPVALTGAVGHKGGGTAVPVDVPPCLLYQGAANGGAPAASPSPGRGCGPAASVCAKEPRPGARNPPQTARGSGNLGPSEAWVAPGVFEAGGPAGVGEGVELLTEPCSLPGVARRRKAVRKRPPTPR